MRRIRRLVTEERVRTAIIVLIGSIAGLLTSIVFELPPSALGSLGAAIGAAVAVLMSVSGEKRGPNLDRQRTIAELQRRARAQSKTLDVLCLSAQNTDYFYKVDRIAPDYETHVNHVTRAPGGSGANTTFALSRLGLKTSIIGIVSDDTDGRYLRDNLQSAGVGTDFLFLAPEGLTGKTIILTTGPERTIIVEPGANNLLHRHYPAHKLAIHKALATTRLLHLTSFVGERERNLQLDLISQIPPDCILAFTPGSIQSKQGLNGLRDVLRRVNILFIYENDLNMLINPDAVPSERRMGIESLINKLYEWRKKNEVRQPLIVLVKNNIRSPREDMLYFSLFYGMEYPHGPFNTAGLELNGGANAIVDTTGAGDACSAGVIYSILTVGGFADDMLQLRKIAHKMALFASSSVGARAGLPVAEKLNPASRPTAGLHL